MDSSSAYQIGQVLGVMVSCVLMLLIPGAFVFTLVMALTRKTRGWIIGAVVSAVVGLLLIGGILASGVYLATKANKEVQVFTSSDQLCSITGASGWRVLDLEAPDATLQIGNLFAEEYLMVIPEGKSELSGIAGTEGIDLIEFSKMASAQTALAVEDADTSALVEAEFGGRRGYQQEMSGSIAGNKISYLLSYVEGKDHLYQIIAWTLTDRKEKTFPRLREAVATFSEAAVP